MTKDAAAACDGARGTHNDIKHGTETSAHSVTGIKLEVEHETYAPGNRNTDHETYAKYVEDTLSTIARTDCKLQCNIKCANV